jgi:hypothetical protein
LVNRHNADQAAGFCNRFAFKKLKRAAACTGTLSNNKLTLYEKPAFKITGVFAGNAATPFPKPG